MKRVTRSAILEHSAGDVYRLVEDIEAYPQFLPWCLAARVHGRSAGATRATLTVGMPGLRQSFTTQNENHPGESIDMKLVEGPFKTFTAGWRFTPLSPRACRIDFTLRYEFSSRALARLLEPLFDSIANSMVDAFTRRAAEVYGRDKG
ncbi:MAG TPA: type II toxin-antitoxin system RatA family toxin [Burkholderiales bacterium]|jgi:ribosome-associated toxin RatA of RatAB toxin-antitoxin module